RVLFRSHFRITTIGKTRSDRRSRRNRGAVPLQPAARLGPQPQRRGPLAHLHLVQCLRQRAAVRAEFASRLGGVEKHRAPARGKRRRRPAGSVNSFVLREERRVGKEGRSRWWRDTSKKKW